MIVEVAVTRCWLSAHFVADMLSVSIKVVDNHQHLMAGSKHVQSSLRTLPSGDDRLHNLLHQLICKKLCISLMLPCLNVQIGFCFP